MLQRIGRALISLLVIAIVLCGILPSQDVEAGTETYNHIIPFTITDTSGVDRTNVPVVITYDVDGKLIAYGLTNATCTNTYVDSSGAGNSPVGSGTAYDYMMTGDNVTIVIPSLTAYGSVTVNLYTGYSPVQTSFPMVFGDGNYVTVSDNATLEFGDDFTSIISGYIDTSTTDNLTFKQDSFNTRRGGGDITSEISLWIYPTGASGWTNSSNAVDGDTGTYASIVVGVLSWSDYLVCNIDPIKVVEYLRYYYNREDSSVETVDIDAYYSGSWQNIYEGAPGDTLIWHAVDVPDGHIVTQIRMRFWNGSAVSNYWVKVYEYEYYNLASSVSVTASGIDPADYTVNTTLNKDAYLGFDGVNNQVNMGDIVDFDATDNFTVVAWFRPDDTDNQFVVVKGSIDAVVAPNNEGYALRILSNALKGDLQDSDSSIQFTSGVTPSTTQWNMGAISVNRATNLAFAYCNGTAGSTVDISGIGDLSNSRSFVVSGYSTDATEQPLDGYGDEVQVYNRPLDEAELDALYVQGRAGEPQPIDDTDLVGWWAMNEGIGNYVYDGSGNNNAGTINGATWHDDGGLRMYIDGVLQDSASCLGSVSNTNSDLILYPDTYWNYYKHYVGGVLVAWYQPNAKISSDILPDRQGADHNGTIAWGSNSDVTITGGAIVDSDSPTSVGTTSGMMHGELIYLGTYSSVYVSFEYGLDSNFGYFTSETSVNTEQPFAVTLTGLSPNTTYHYRAIARSGSVYSYGADTTFTTAYSTSSQGSTTPLIITAGVFGGYQQSGDLLFTAELVLTYPPYYPTKSPTRYFQMQLVDTDGTTLLGASPVSQWGDRPASVYMNSTVASGLTYGEAYTIRLVNISSENITGNATYTLAATDWRGNDLIELDSWCIGVATSMQNTDGTLLTDPYLTAGTAYGIQITNTAGGYFVKGIPAIASVRPNLFATGEYKETVPALSDTIGYNAGVAMADRVGTDIDTDAQTIADVFGITGQEFLLYAVFAVVICIIAYVVSQTQGFGAVGALCLCVPIMGAAMYHDILDVQLLVIAGVLGAFLFVWKFVFKAL